MRVACDYPGCTETSSCTTVDERKLGINLCDPSGKPSHYLMMIRSNNPSEWVAENLRPQYTQEYRRGVQTPDGEFVERMFSNWYPDTEIVRGMLNPEYPEPTCNGFRFVVQTRWVSQTRKVVI